MIERFMAFARWVRARYPDWSPARGHIVLVALCGRNEPLYGKLRAGHALVAQGIEHGSPKAGVAGSNPAGGTGQAWYLVPLIKVIHRLFIVYGAV